MISKELYAELQRYININTEEDTRFAEVKTRLSQCTAEDWNAMDEVTRHALYVKALEINDLRTTTFSEFISEFNLILTEMKEMLAESRNKKNRLLVTIEDLERRLEERYSFDVFYPKTVNFGIIATYRQKWSPIKYQVGELISNNSPCT